MSAETVANLRGISAKDAAIFDRLVAPSRPQTKHGMTVHEGSRIIVFGKTGSGKTSLMRGVVATMLQRRYAEFALIHDTKGIFPEYPRSIQLPNINAFVARGGLNKGDIPIYSFRGDVRQDVEVSAEEVAGFSRYLLKQGQTGEDGIWRPRPILTVIEELAAAATAGGKHVSAPSVKWISKEGRKVGGSLLGTTQSPREVPLALPDQASAIVYFSIKGADSNYLAERLHIDDEIVSALRGASNEGLPDYKFIVAISGEPWDREIHQLDAKTVRMFE